MNIMEEYKQYRELTYKIIGVAMEAHRELGYGLLEGVYEEAMSIELNERGIKNNTQEKLRTYYKGHLLTKYYKADLVVDDIICELKSKSNLDIEDRAQLCNYMRLTKKPLGLLINFGKKSLECERWALDANTNRCFMVNVNLEPLSKDIRY